MAWGSEQQRSRVRVSFFPAAQVRSRRICHPSFMAYLIRIQHSAGEKERHGAASFQPLHALVCTMTIIEAITYLFQGLSRTLADIAHIRQRGAAVRSKALKFTPKLRSRQSVEDGSWTSWRRASELLMLEQTRDFHSPTPSLESVHRNVKSFSKCCFECKCLPTRRKSVFTFEEWLLLAGSLTPNKMKTTGEPTN